jgi:hypothetical protein
MDTQDSNDESESNRITYAIARKLSSLSNHELSLLLDKGGAITSGIGGTSQRPTVDNTPIFAKRVPLSELELQHMHSTANIFDLPLYCQYGIGSPGFGAWRELAAHVMASNWAALKECPNFPRLYHWRILSKSQATSLNMDEWGNEENYLKYWNNSPALRKRLESINNASSEIVLFLEYRPETLSSWLKTKLSSDENTMQDALNFVDKSLNATNTFMSDRGFIHFDAHFDNILTDGKKLYFSDFGLAMSNQFDLSAKEIEFFNIHINNYDRNHASLYLVHSVITNLFGKENWRQKLKAYLQDAKMDMPKPCAQVINKHGRTAQTMDEFLQELKQSPSTTIYPTKALALTALVTDSII